MARAYGLTAAVLLARIERGWTIEEAVGLVRRLTSKSLDFDGVTYDSLADLANNKCVSITALYSRLKSGMTLEDAIIAAGEKIRNAGRYNHTILARDDELANKPGVLYFVSIEINGNTRHKVGITTESISSRLNKEGYKYKIIKIIQGTLLYCYTLEQEILGLLFDKRDMSITSEMLDGYSEIFCLDDSDVSIVFDLLS